MFRAPRRVRVFVPPSRTDDPFWIDLTVLRNYTVHTHNEDLADYVYSRLAETVGRFRALLNATT